MVKTDLIGRGIKDLRVLEVMSRVPRHLFVPRSHQSLAYEDHPLPIGEGQTISQPYVVALMSELLMLKGTERVLEVGTGSGYQAAVLSRLAWQVYTIEILPSLAKGAKERLERLGYSNVQVKIGDGFFGWKDKGPYDGIVVTASAKEIPGPLWRQLQEGGRLVMPLGESPKPQRLVRVTKINGKRQVETITGVIFVPMTGEVQEGSP
jgi:protein-L-isoaspartate(D-aspartate) O-methyltransferase